MPGTRPGPADPGATPGASTAAEGAGSNDQSTTSAVPVSGSATPASGGPGGAGAPSAPVGLAGTGATPGMLAVALFGLLVLGLGTVVLARKRG